MMRNRQRRRAMKRNAAANASMLAERCYDYDGAAMMLVKDPVAIAALRKAFTLMLEGGGEPMAVPITEAEARAFPHHPGQLRVVPGGACWLAVGMDISGRATYSMQSVGGLDQAIAQEAAKATALSRLSGSLQQAGFPAIWQEPKGHA